MGCCSLGPVAATPGCLEGLKAGAGIITCIFMPLIPNRGIFASACISSILRDTASSGLTHSSRRALRSFGVELPKGISARWNPPRFVPLRFLRVSGVALIGVWIVPLERSDLRLDRARRCAGRPESLVANGRRALKLVSRLEVGSSSSVMPRYSCFMPGEECLDFALMF